MEENELRIEWLYYYYHYFVCSLFILKVGYMTIVEVTTVDCLFRRSGSHRSTSSCCWSYTIHLQPSAINSIIISTKIENLFKSTYEQQHLCNHNDCKGIVLVTIVSLKILTECFILVASAMFGAIFSIVTRVGLS